jgi:hypothetical protein
LVVKLKEQDEVGPNNKRADRVRDVVVGGALVLGPEEMPVVGSSVDDVHSNKLGDL